ncbi:hypothetical protein [uncultured Tessaracoccus sp.]|uniref:hypothetical protein n=1 Tax=uncultured Tessaracoccus sp. TaxID=905023 RepID=UPI0025F341B1|nr:hypothetical protein [uncultured Tessaracoccus sp.]
MFDDDDQIRVYVPPGWPRTVPPPGAPGWTEAARDVLLDVAPPEYRSYQVLRRHPVVLARFTMAHVEGQLAATRAELGGVRAALADVVDGGVVARAVDVLQREEARIVRVRRAVGLLEEALRGATFVPRL